MPKLEVVITSTRPGRAGKPIGDWFVGRARAHGKFDVAVSDLAELNLPFLDEPKHPRLGQYEHAHSKAWSKTVDAADAFVFVVPEYNYGMPPTLLNALDYLAREWAYKPAGFVSYGGMSGGTRSVQMAKMVLPTLKLMPIPEAVSIPFFNKHLAEGVFTPDAPVDQAVPTMLEELLRWANALAPLR